MRKNLAVCLSLLSLGLLSCSVNDPTDVVAMEKFIGDCSRGYIDSRTLENGNGYKEVCIEICKEGFVYSSENQRCWDDDGYDEDGFNIDGYNADGLTRLGCPMAFPVYYNKKCYNKDGYDEEGFDYFGCSKLYSTDGKVCRDKDGYDKDGFNTNNCPVLFPLYDQISGTCKNKDTYLDADGCGVGYSLKIDNSCRDEDGYDTEWVDICGCRKTTAHNYHDYSGLDCTDKNTIKELSLGYKQVDCRDEDGNDADGCPLGYHIPSLLEVSLGCEDQWEFNGCLNYNYDTKDCSSSLKSDHSSCMGTYNDADRCAELTDTSYKPCSQFFLKRNDSEKSLFDKTEITYCTSTEFQCPLGFNYINQILTVRCDTYNLNSKSTTECFYKGSIRECDVKTVQGTYTIECDGTEVYPRNTYEFILYEIDSPVGSGLPYSGKTLKYSDIITHTSGRTDILDKDALIYELIRGNTYAYYYDSIFSYNSDITTNSTYLRYMDAHGIVSRHWLKYLCTRIDKDIDGNELLINIEGQPFDIKLSDISYVVTYK